MKQKSTSLARTIPALLLCLLCLIPTAYANSGPRPEITITVVNAPEGLICFDLLLQGDHENGSTYGSNAKCDPDIINNLRSLEGDGWILSGYFTAAGSVRPREDGTWLFYRPGFSEPFRIAVANAESAQATQTPYVPDETFINLVYDWETNTVREATPSPLRFLARLASTLVPTLIIERLVFWLFGFRAKRSWLIFLAVNVVTQTAMHLIFAWNIPIAGSHPLYYALLFIPSEVVICAVEAVAYVRLLKEQDRRRRVRYAITSNVVSAVLGYFPLHLLYDFLKSL